ncbi:hypothetical protein ILUMI_06216 [Ignelater luminosus]|uniref:Uncharacterized protein n=1 Tax=Ignelater luminosus TaxID=2038154 RepID=A0A8K0GHF0_IGNLU|nr:hypothetical protein ILUMI_06216 [Ignelater luminosus]
MRASMCTRNNEIGLCDSQQDQDDVHFYVNKALANLNSKGREEHKGRAWWSGRLDVSRGITSGSTDMSFGAEEMMLLLIEIIKQVPLDKTGTIKIIFSTTIERNRLWDLQYIKHTRRQGAGGNLGDQSPPDNSRTEQMSLYVRYIDPDKICLKEDFIEFVPVQDLTGEGIALTIMSRLQPIGINLNTLIEQGYDRASAMSGSFKGAQAVITRQFPLALYVHCSAHLLNLIIADTCKVRVLSNCLSTIHSIKIIFRTSALGINVLKEAIERNMPKSRLKNLVVMCETRWVQKHDSVIRFDELLIPIAEAPEKLKQTGNRETFQTANQLISAIQINLCKFLQGVDCDLSIVCEHVDDVISTLSQIRQNADNHYSELFKYVFDAAKQLYGDDYEISVPRRNNVEADTAEE